MKHENLRFLNFQFLISHFGNQSALARAINHNTDKSLITQQKISSILATGALPKSLSLLIERRLTIPADSMDNFYLKKLYCNDIHLRSLIKLDKQQRSAIHRLYKASIDHHSKII